MYPAENSLSPISLQDNLSYWKEKLEGISVLELPTDFLRPAIQSSSTSKIDFSIEKELLEGLQQLSNQQGVTLFITLLSAYKVLLNRYSRQQDIAVGIANPIRKEVEAVSGCFTNILILRSEVTSNSEFMEFIQQVKVTTLEAYDHQDVTLRKVAETLVKKRDLGRNLLFQVMFIFQNVPPIPNEGIAEVEVSEGYESNISQCDLKFILTETVIGLKASAEYCTDLFKEQTILRMIGHYKELLGSIVKQPHQKIGLLFMLTAEEEYQLLVEFNDTNVDYPKDKTIVDLFEEQAAKTPEAIAVVFEEEQLTYKDLNKRANQLAHYLRSKGVKEETLVPICIERSLEMIIGILGILKAGGAYVPIDSDYPLERINFMLKDTGATVVISSKESSMKMQSRPDLHIIKLDEKLQALLDQPVNNVPTSLSPQNLCYVIYTSGSTGKPKGVMIEHQGLLDHCYGLIKSAQLNTCTSFALFSPLVFDAGHSIIFSSFFLGATLHILSNELIVDGEKLVLYLKNNSVDCIKIVPSVWLSYINGNNIVLSNKVMIFGGESFPEKILQHLVKLHFCGDVYNHYGPTETTIGKCIYKVDLQRSYTNIPIGKPFSNTHLYIVDQLNQIVPIGVPGELYISGEGVARKYLNRPDLTTEKFITNPFNSNTTARLYKTGDKARWIADGNVEYMGRIDEQVKIRGHRIEPGEIENVLIECKGVKQAAVLAYENKQGNKILVGYIVAERLFNKQTMITYLQGKLPEYMIPVMWVELERLPLTRNGKIDKKALSDSCNAEALNDIYVAPRNEAELALAKIWERVLEIEKVGIYDNFFEIGGNSIQAAQIFSIIRKKLGKNLPLSILFQAATIDQLAIYIIEKRTGIFWSSLVPIQPNGSKPPLFCLHAGAGTVLLYNSLSLHLGIEQPIYGLQAKGLNGTESPHTNIEDMATHYINEIRIVQPEGPYFLAGYCLGGILAFEIAQQLTRQMLKVALLVSFNGISPTSEQPLDPPIIEENGPESGVNFFHKITNHWKKFIPMNTKGKILYIIKISVRKLLTYNQQFYIRKLFYRFYISRNRPLPELLGKYYFLDTNHDIARAYKPKPYPGKMIIFRSPKIYVDPCLGWEGLVTGCIETCDIPGEHKDRRQIMNEPFIKYTAEKLNKYLIK